MKEENKIHSWSSVDHTTDPGYFRNYLDTVSATESMQNIKRETYEMLDIGEGSRVLDVGCGTGDDVFAIAQIVGTKGHVFGVDNSEAMIAEAFKRARGMNLSVKFQVGDAHALDFADNIFDGCRAERVFQHIEDQKLALSEMVRVARPGARIVIAEPDWETFVIDMPKKVLTRKVVNYVCDETKNGWCGRELPRLFKDAKLLDIFIHARTFICTDYALADQLYDLKQTVGKLQECDDLTASEADEWLENLQNADKAGQFFCAVTGFLVRGCKPL